MQNSLFIVLSGGVAPDRVEVIDFDTLLTDVAEVGHTVRAWRALSDAAKQYVLKMYPSEYANIQKRIDEDLESILR